MTTAAIRRQYIERLFHDAGVVELRALGGKAVSGLYDDPQAFFHDARRLWDHGSVYTTLNAPTPRPISNKLGKDKALKDSDIGWIVRLPFDFDPSRPSGTSSTDGELALALASRDRTVNFLTALGWPQPIRAISGNGYHAQYRVKIPSNDDTRALLRRVYTGLAERFGSDEVHFDVTVRNPSRIFRLYGTVNKKGISTPERPHRLADVNLPTSLQVVTQTQLQNLANLVSPVQARPAPKNAHGAATTPGNGNGRGGDYKTLNIVGYFRSHGLYLGPSQLDGKHFVLCPWSVEHSFTGPTDTIIFEADGGWPGFHCSHNHCVGRNVLDVANLLGDADRFCSRVWGAAS